MKNGDEFGFAFSWKWFILLIVIAIVVWLIWVIGFGYTNCQNWECFNEELKSCDKARFIGGSDMIFEYAIRGISDGECTVDVKLLQGELNSRDSVKLQGREMTCSLPLGVVLIPESDIDNCRGYLKEGLQDSIIKKLHTYLVQNLGTLNLEVLELPTV